MTRQAHALGIRVMLKPHVWGRGEPDSESWSDADWRSLVRRLRPLRRPLRHDRPRREDRRLLHRQRAEEHQPRTSGNGGRSSPACATIYRGPLTYGANFDEVFDVPFWDALDWIGVSGYFPLVDAASPDLRALEEAWQPIVKRLEQLS